MHLNDGVAMVSHVGPIGKSAGKLATEQYTKVHMISESGLGHRKVDRSPGLNCKYS